MLMKSVKDESGETCCRIHGEAALVQNSGFDIPKVFFKNVKGSESTVSAGLQPTKRHVGLSLCVNVPYSFHGRVGKTTLHDEEKGHEPASICPNVRPIRESPDGN